MAETERYDEDRPEMVNLVPPMAHRVLDVGCSTGRFGAALREHMPDAEIIGIDTRPQSAATMSSYDRFITGMFPGDMPSALPFDCVVFNDVLEHMVDPWDVLRHTHSMLTPTASVIASIPNIRHVSVLAPLAIKGRWDYRDTGILDRTHLRFFTRASVH